MSKFLPPDILQISAADEVILLAGRLWDGNSSTLAGPAVIHIKGGLIAAIEFGPSAAAAATALTEAAAGFEMDNPVVKGTKLTSSWEGIQLVDCSSLTVLPGLIDCHIHLALDGRDFVKAKKRWEEPAPLAHHLQTALDSYLAEGVLVVRDGGDLPGIGFTTSRKIAAGQLRGPQVLTSGQAIRRQEKYGSFLGAGVQTLREGLAQIEALAAAGVHQIKIITSGIVSFSTYGKVGPLQFSAGELREMTAAAHNLGLKVMAHASSNQAVQVCLEGRVDSIEHGYFITVESLRAMADLGTAWVPTVAPVANQVLLSHCRENFSSEEADVITRTYQSHLDKLSLALRLGVPVAAGTDAGAGGVAHGAGLHDELVLFVQGGLSPIEALKAATSTAAQVLGVNEKWGSLEVGKAPLCIAVEGNPLDDLSALHRIHLVTLPA